MKRKVKYLNNSRQLKCWVCEGNGCRVCNGSGLYTEEHYHLITKDKNGQKIAFGVDSLK